jgi:hypothetical protein
MASNPVINKAALKANTQKGLSFNNPVANTAVSLSQGQPGLSFLNGHINEGPSAAHSQPTPFYSDATVHVGTSIPKGKPGSAVLNPGMNTAALVQGANQSALSRGKAPRANMSARRSQGSPSQSTPRSKKAVLPWVPDPPPSGVLTPPPTPRPSRLPSPDLSPIDPGAYYPTHYQSLVTFPADLCPRNALEDIEWRNGGELDENYTNRRR